MVADEIAAYLVGASLGLTTAAPTPNLYARPFPLGSPDAAVAIDVYSGHPSERVFGSGKPATASEKPIFHVFVRDARDNDAAAAALAQAIYDAMDGFGPLTLSGVVYRDIRTIDGGPKFFAIDENMRSIYVLNFEADKDRS